MPQRPIRQPRRQRRMPLKLAHPLDLQEVFAVGAPVARNLHPHPYFSKVPAFPPQGGEQVGRTLPHDRRDRAGRVASSECRSRIRPRERDRPAGAAAGGERRRSAQLPLQARRARRQCARRRQGCGASGCSDDRGCRRICPGFDTAAAVERHAAMSRRVPIEHHSGHRRHGARTHDHARTGGTGPPAAFALLVLFLAVHLRVQFRHAASGRPPSSTRGCRRSFSPTSARKRSATRNGCRAT